MKIKAVALAVAMLTQPLALIPGIAIEAALAASVGGGGGGGPGGPGGSEGEKGGVMQAMTCETKWNLKEVEEALRLQKQICTPLFAASTGSTQVQ